MSNQIFLSHSKRDEESLRPIFDVLSKASLRTYQADFEEIGQNPAETLKQKIENSRLLMVILGPNAAELEHTKMWISWEVGVMTEVGNPIWVIEDINNQISLPVPYLTDYLLWNGKQKYQKWQFRNILESEYAASGSIRRRAREELKKEEEKISDRDAREENKIQCIECGQRYRLRSHVNEFDCPACLKPLEVA
jgi:hypothetical protein